MEVTSAPAKSILTPQSRGLLASPPYPFTHSLSPYTGCAFGNTACGRYCYAQFLPNWVHGGEGAAWGSAVRVKENAAELLAAELARLGPARRSRARIFMASTTDPYQPIEARHRVTRRCLEVFARHDDLDLLLVQTRGPLAARDFDLLARIPYAWLSVTVETDDQELLRRLGGAPPIGKRLALVEAAGRQGIKTQVAISPCLAYTPDFADRLLATGARRFVVDTLVEGDGGRGGRTARSPIAAVYPNWRDETAARALYERLRAAGAEVGWSASGFCGIPPRSLQLSLVG
jgi:DNA repair photolyase